MAGRLLLVVLMYPFSEIKAQALLPPQLTMNPPVITETDSVTLNCQTPSSVSVTECYFHIVRGGTAKSFPCLQTLTGTELLKMSSQSSPAEVKVTCFYLNVVASPDSDMSSIIIRTSLPPKLTVNPPVITETDSVTLNCEAPSSASVPLCSFFTSSGGTGRFLSCLQTLTGSELLEISQQRSPASPAEVQVTCFYTVKLGAKNYPSPHSDTSSITIHTGLTVSTPHASLPPVTPVTPETPETSVASGWTVGTSSNTVSLISTFLTSVKPASETDIKVTPVNPESGDKITAETRIFKFAAVVAGCGVTVGVILLVSACLCNKRRTGAGSEGVKRGREAQKENLDTYHLYCTVSEEPAASALMGSAYSTVQPH